MSFPIGHPWLTMANSLADLDPDAAKPGDLVYEVATDSYNFRNQSGGWSQLSSHKGDAAGIVLSSITPNPATEGNAVLTITGTGLLAVGMIQTDKGSGIYNFTSQTDTELVGDASGWPADTYDLWATDGDLTIESNHLTFTVTPA